MGQINYRPGESRDLHLSQGLKCDTTVVPTKTGTYTPFSRLARDPGSRRNDEMGPTNNIDLTIY